MVSRYLTSIFILLLVLATSVGNSYGLRHPKAEVTLLVAPQDLNPERKNRIEVVLKGVQDGKGVVRLAMFNKKQGFPSDHKSAYRLMVTPAKSGKVTMLMTAVPEGKYAIVAYHDRNNNNKLDVNLLGMPTEHYGVSNNARNRLSAPKFESALFSHPDSITTVQILMK